MEENFERNHGEEEKKLPELLDIVKIDSRWAQVKGGGDLVTFLDTGVSEEIDWNQYALKRSFHSVAVKGMDATFGEIISSEEIKRIHWGSEDENNPDLKEQVRVFGEYEKK